jgi:nucleotide-binding universal stress UspA family protein
MSARVLLIAVDDSNDSQKAFEWAVHNLYRDGDEVHLVHVIPRLQFAAAYGVPPVDFVPAAENTSYETVVQKAEQFIIERFVRSLPAGFGSPPVVHIVKVSLWCWQASCPFCPLYIHTTTHGNLCPHVRHTSPHVTGLLMLL